MLKNYLTTAWRSFARYKGYTFLHIIGLSVAICCGMLIMLFVKGEFTFDSFHTKADRLYRAWMQKNDNGTEIKSTITSLPLGPSLQKNIPEVESACRVYAFSSLVKNNNSSFNEPVRMVDDPFFTMFDFKLLEGDPGHPWPNSHSIIISAAKAKKYFNSETPLGKTIELQLGEDKVFFTISGVVENNPPESSIRTDFLIPFSNDHFLFNERMRTRAWGKIFTETYVLLKKEATAISLENKIPGLIKQEVGNNDIAGAGTIHLQSIKSIHLDTSLPQGLEPISDPTTYYILSTIGLFIIILACINFLTISIGRSTTRSLEIGVRKVLGARRRQLVSQFFGEAFLLTVISVIIGFILTVLLFNPFQLLIGKDLTLRLDFEFIIFCLLLIVFISVVAGIYPALVLSGSQPITTLKGKTGSLNKIGLFRKTLITGQFVVSIVIIICTLVVHQQLDFLDKKDLGYTQENIIIVPTNLPLKDGLLLANVYQHSLHALPAVTSSSVVTFGLDEDPWAEMGYADEHHSNHNFQFNSVDVSFLKTMNVQLAEGNNFLSNTDSSVLINETYVKEYNLKNAVGKKLPGPFNQRIIGVLRDFNIESLHTKIKPLVLSTKFETILATAETMLFHYALKPKIVIRLAPGNLAREIGTLKSAWQKITPSQEFEYKFLDQKIALRYEPDKRTGAIVMLASALSIFIACMGLFGLVAQVVVNRTREIGIRKVLGAGTAGLVNLVSKDFIKLVMIAMLIAAPIAWFFAHQWLQDFVYKIEVNRWSFVLAGLASLFIALITISVQAVGAATNNPVKNLRTE